jgi:hypothetical protein
MTKRKRWIPKVKGSYYLHLLSAIDESQNRFQISNNHGHVNGWVTADKVYGVCVQVKDNIILSEQDFEKRRKDQSSDNNG